MTARARLMLIALGTCWLWACGDELDAECLSTCERLDACGFLPSVLAPQGEAGEDLVDSCAQHCAASDTAFASEVHSCAARVGDPQQQWIWCGGAEGSVCEQASICLQARAAQDVPIVGEVALRLEARLGGAPNRRRPGPCDPEDEVAESERGELFAAGELCNELNIQSVEYFVQSSTPRTATQSKSQDDTTTQWHSFGSCTAGVERGSAFEVTPGPVTAGIRLKGSVPSNDPDDDPVPACITYYAPRRILRAGTEVVLPVYLPQNGRLPIDPNACGDL